MTQEEFKIFSDKYQETLTKFQERLKSRPNETYRDEMIVCNTDAIIMLIQHVEALTEDIFDLAKMAHYPNRVENSKVKENKESSN